MIRNLKLGYDLRANLQQSFGVPTATPDICAQTQSALTGNARIDHDGLGVCVRHYCLCLGTPAINRSLTVCATCDGQNIDSGQPRRHTGLYPNSRNRLRRRSAVPVSHVVSCRRQDSLWTGASPGKGGDKMSREGFGRIILRPDEVGWGRPTGP